MELSLVGMAAEQWEVRNGANLAYTTLLLRMLGVGSAKRTTRQPNLPTIAESVKGYEAEQWYGVVAPANTPPAIVNKLANELKTIGAQPDVRERFYSQGIEPASATPAEFAITIKANVGKYSRIIKQLGLRQD